MLFICLLRSWIFNDFLAESEFLENVYGKKQFFDQETGDLCPPGGHTGPDIVRDICGIMGGTNQNHQGGAKRGKRTPPPSEGAGGAAMGSRKL